MLVLLKIQSSNPDLDVNEDWSDNEEDEQKMEQLASSTKESDNNNNQINNDQVNIYDVSDVC